MKVGNKKADKPGDWRRQPQYFQIQLAAEDINKDDRTIEVSITAETIAQRWYGNLVLGHNPGECRLERILKTGSFLFAHGRDPFYGVVPLGPILNVWLDEKARKYRARLKFDEDERSELLYQKVLSGSLRGISVAVRFYKILEVSADAEERGIKGPFYLAVDWDIEEISLEPTPELMVGVGLSAVSAGAPGGGSSGLTGINDDEGEDGMRYKVKRNGLEVEVEEAQLTAEERVQFGLDPPAAPPGQTQTQTQAGGSGSPGQETGGGGTGAQLTAAQVDEVLAMCQRFSVSMEEARGYIRDGLTVQQIKDRILDKLAAERAPIPAVQVLQDETEKFRAAATDGLILRAGQITLPKPAPGADQFRGMRLLDLARFCAERRLGKDLRFADNETILRAALGFGEHGQFMGVSDFPGILSNVANKSLSTAYEAAGTTYQLWVRIGSLSDFKIATIYTLSHAADVEEIKPDGEFTVAEFTESGRTIKLATFGKRWGLNRQAIINDDLNAIAIMPVRMATGVRRKINYLVYNILNSNPVIDGDPLFHANHKNLAGTGGALSVTTLGAGKAAMAKQRDIGSKQTLNIQPAFLLVPVELEVTATQLVTSTVDPSKTNATPNPFQNRLTVVADPELSEGSATAWYLAGAPAITDTIEVAFLNGIDRPTIESQVSFDILGVNWRIYHDFGVALLDWRAFYKNPGQ